MTPGDDKIVADRLHALLTEKRPPKPAMASPAASLSGRWDVEIEYFSSKSRHTFLLQQDGNEIQGSHKSDFSVQEISGVIEGNQVKLRSSVTERGSGDNVTYFFSGSVSGDTISGPIFLGEYLNAKYTARRVTRRPPGGNFMIPGGPPLAT